MARKSNKLEETRTAIRDLLSARVVRGKASPKDLESTELLLSCGVEAESDEDPVEFLLNTASVQALFDTLPPDTFVSKHLAAAYCRCSVLSLERRLGAKWSTPTKHWTAVLQQKRPPRYDSRKRLRWDLVQASARQWEERSVRRQEARGGPKDPLVAALVRRYEFLCHADHTVEAAWGQASLTKDRVVEIINAGGYVKLMTVRKALALPWADVAARQPWQRGVSVALDDMRREIALGQSATEARLLSEIIGKVPPSPRRTPL